MGIAHAAWGTDIYFSWNTVNFILSYHQSIIESFFPGIFYGIANHPYVINSLNMDLNEIIWLDYLDPGSSSQLSIIQNHLRSAQICHPWRPIPINLLKSLIVDSILTFLIKPKRFRVFNMKNMLDNCNRLTLAICHNALIRTFCRTKSQTM